jgi:hypothetical protein
VPLHDSISRRMAGLGEVSKTAGRPRVEARQRDATRSVVAMLPVSGLSRRAQAVWLSEVWGGHPSVPRVNIPNELRYRVEDELGLGRGSRRSDKDVARFASAVIAALPPRLHAAVARLRRDGRDEEAAYEEVHDQLEVAVRWIRRRAQRNRQIVSERDRIVAGWDLPVDSD